MKGEDKGNTNKKLIVDQENNVRRSGRNKVTEPDF